MYVRVIAGTNDKTYSESQSSLGEWNDRIETMVFYKK